MVVAILLGTFCMSAVAKEPPISLLVAVDRMECGYLGIINVTITVSNTSAKDVKNIVVTSSDSENLVTHRSVVNNVSVTNPGSIPERKSSAIVSCLKPGGTLKYSYSVLIGYQYALNKIPKATGILMEKQHKLLKTKQFKEVGINTGNCRYVSVPLTFGDLPAVLDVKAFYGVKDESYKTIASGGVASEAKAEANKSSGSGRSANYSKAVTVTETEAQQNTDYKYILNKATLKIHYPDCSDVDRIKEENIEYSNDSVEELEKQGYKTCRHCFG